MKAAPGDALAGAAGRHPSSKSVAEATEEALGRRRARKAAETAKSDDSAVPIPACNPAMFRGVLGEIAAAADPGTEADKVGVYGSLLSATSAAIGKGPHVRISNTNHPLLVWSLLIGRTNIGRKGEATNTAMRVMRQACEDIDGITESGLSSGEGLIERIRDKDPEIPNDPGGTEDKRLLVIETELATMMAALAREGTKLPGVLRQAWGGDRLSSLNRKRVIASHSHIAILGHITPREFLAKIRGSDMAGGTWNRYLPLYVERRKLMALPEGFDDDIELPRLAISLNKALQAAREHRLVGLDSSAANLWTGQLYSEFTDFEDDTPAADFVQRAAAYCRRIAALYAVLDDRSRANAGDFQAAAHLIRYSIASARYVFDPAPRDVKLDRLRRAVDEAGADGITRESAGALFGRHLPKEQLDELISKLTADGTYQRREIRGGGRPKTVIERARKARKAR